MLRYTFLTIVVWTLLIPEKNIHKMTMALFSASFEGR